nr:pyruvate ferredoxin oxidoreductase [Anaerolineae bacterium]
MSRTEVRLCGFGGQGIILAGLILGKAAVLFDRKEATLTQSYGPESRGGACSAQLIISDEMTRYPHLTRPSLIVAMSQEAYTKYHGELADGGLLLIDEDLVRPETEQEGVRVLSIPATRLAEQELGRRVVANIVMLGFLAAVSDVVSTEALRQAVLSTVPKGTEELNERAFETGYRYGLEAGKASAWRAGGGGPHPGPPPRGEGGPHP